MENKYKTTKIIFIFFISLSIIIFIIGMHSLFMNLTKIENCTEKVTATCSSIRMNTGGKHNRHSHNHTYRHVFFYEYNNRKYEITYGRSYSKENKDVFGKGKEYTIYVNPEFPSQFIVEGHENDIDTLAIAGPIIGASMTILFTVIYFIFKKHKIK